MPGDDGVRVFWAPALADPEHPTIAELAGGVDLSDLASDGWLSDDGHPRPDPTPPEPALRTHPLEARFRYVPEGPRQPASAIWETLFGPGGRPPRGEVKIVLSGRGSKRVRVPLPGRVRLTINGYDVDHNVTLYAPPAYARAMRRRLLDRRLRPMHTAYSRRLRARRHRRRR